MQTSNVKYNNVHKPSQIFTLCCCMCKNQSRNQYLHAASCYSSSFLFYSWGLSGGPDSFGVSLSAVQPPGAQRLARAVMQACGLACPHPGARHGPWERFLGCLPCGIRRSQLLGPAARRPVQSKGAEPGLGHVLAGVFGCIYLFASLHTTITPSILPHRTSFQLWTVTKVLIFF